MSLRGGFVRAGLRGLGADVCAFGRFVARIPSWSRSRWGKGSLLGLMTFWMLAVASGSAHAVLSFQDAVRPEAPTSEPWDSLSTAQDSHGLTLADYALSLNTGGLREPITAASAFMLEIGWGAYRLTVGIALWMLEIVTEFTWLDVLRVPADAFANVVGAVIGDLGLVPALATISVLVSGLLLWRGQSGAAFGEIFTTLVVASLFTTALVNPVGTVAGDNGVLATTKDLGLAVSQQLMGDDGSGEVRMPSGRVMEAMVRLPHQYINYGTHIDASGGGCVEAYNGVLLEGGEYGDLGGACPQSAIDAAENPKNSYPVALLVGPGALLLLGFVLALSVALFLLTALVVWQAAKFVWEMLKGLLPGTSRVGLFTAMTTVVVGCGLIVGGLMAVAVFVMVLDEVYTATESWNPIQVFAFVDIMLLVTIVVVVALFMRGRKMGRELGEKVAGSLSPRPTALPARSGLSLGRVASSAAGVYASHRAMSRMQRSSGGSGGGGGGAGGGAVPAPSTRGRKPSGLVTGAKIAAKGTVKGAALAAKVALGSTVLAPVAVPRAAVAAKGVMSARKTALAAKLASAGARASTVAKDKHKQVVDYGKEYGHNVAVAGRATARAGRHVKQVAGETAQDTAMAARLAAHATGADKAAAKVTLSAAARMGPRAGAVGGGGSTTAVHAPADPARAAAAGVSRGAPVRARGTSPTDLPQVKVPAAPQVQAASARRTSRLRAILNPITARRRRRAA